MTVTESDTGALLAERDALVDALVAAQDRQSALVALMKVSTNTLDIDELTRRMLNEALEATESDVVVLSCAHGRPNQRAQHRNALTMPQINDILDGLLREMRLGSGLHDGIPWAVTAFPSFPSVGIAIGRVHGPAYSTGDLRMLGTVAVAVEQLTQLSRLHTQVVRQAAVEKEHQVASRLAQAVMPTWLPHQPGVDFFARCSPAALTGGDFMVCTEVDDAIWFAVGDVAGKGLPAAMIMTQAVAAVRVALRTGDPDNPAAAMMSIGRELNDYLGSVESFITLAIGSHRRGSGRVSLCNAGHSPVVYVSDAGARPRHVGPSAPPLGVVVSRPPRTETFPFRPQAQVIVGTDGLVEQPNPAGVMIGYDEFMDSCATPTGSAAELGELLMARVEDHAAGMPAADDRTLVVIRAVREESDRQRAGGERGTDV